MRNPAVRVRAAWVLFALSVIAGIGSTVLLAKDPYERVLMGISWGAIAITALDVVATTDVRAKEEEEK